MESARIGYALLPTIDILQKEANIEIVHGKFNTRDLLKDHTDRLERAFATSTYQNLLFEHRVEVAVDSSAVLFPENHNWQYPKELPLLRMKPLADGSPHPVFTMIGQHRIEASKQMLAPYLVTMDIMDARLKNVAEEDAETRAARSTRKKIFNYVRMHGCWLAVVYAIGERPRSVVIRFI